MTGSGSGAGASSPTPTPAWRARPGSACRFARSPTPRTACWRSTCCGRASPRHTCRTQPCCTPTTTPRWSTCAAASMSGGDCARCTAGASRSTRGTWWANSAGRGLLAICCVWPAPCSAPARTGSRRGCWSGARALRQWTSILPRTPLADRKPSEGTNVKDNLEAPSLRRRIQLTYQYLGWRTVLFRVVTFPLRATPLKRYLRLQGRGTENAYHRAVAWYREHGKPVDIVIPSYRDAERVATLVASVRKTVPAGGARIIVADDASGPEHVRALRAIAEIEVLAGEENRGFAANVNRGLRAADPARDVVVLNSDTEARPGWLACLQYAASQEDDVGVVGARLVYPDGRIQFAGTVRNLGAPEWFDHRYRFKPEGWGPAGLAGPVLAVTGACMYLTRAALERVGLFDERYPMAYEDVDWCLRAWQAGLRVMYFPAASLYHHESVTRGTEVGERERTSQCVFWERWGEFFDAREVRAENGRLR